MTRKVLSRNTIPTNLPLSSSIIAYLLLDKLDVAGWVWGATGTFFVLLWIFSIALIVAEEQVDLLTEDE